MSREHRRAKTDRLDTELLKRGFLGWLRGERGHCSMVRVPTLAEEDAKRPNRERECLVKERTRLVNRMKGTLARLGIRNFRLTLRNAAENNSALAKWYQARTADHRGATRKTMIVALARKLLIALWRFVTIGEPLDGVTLRPAS